MAAYVIGIYVTSVCTKAAAGRQLPETIIKISCGNVLKANGYLLYAYALFYMAS